MPEQRVFLTGGSGGLGLELSKILAAKGANITIFARNQGNLSKAESEINEARRSPTQSVKAISLDLSDTTLFCLGACLIEQQVREVFESEELPDTLYCVAGGAIIENGYIVDISTTDIETCMRNNYLTCAYAAQAMLKLWTEDDKNATRTNPDLLHSRRRRIVLVSSAAAFVALPGYIAYTPSKCAVRALADTLRGEALRYSREQSTYSVHCAFPSNFVSDAFIEEQKYKPSLTKRMEGSMGTPEDLVKRFPSSREVAVEIVEAVEKGDFAICDRPETSLLFAGMLGPSPRRGWGIWDSFLALAGGLMWPPLRWYWDRMCARGGDSFRADLTATEAP